MFIETDFRPQGEVAVESEALRLARLIRAGHEKIEEDRACYLRAGRGCALGAAFVESGGTEKEIFFGAPCQAKKRS